MGHFLMPVPSFFNDTFRGFNLFQITPKRRGSIYFSDSYCYPNPNAIVVCVVCYGNWGRELRLNVV